MAAGSASIAITVNHRDVDRLLRNLNDALGVVGIYHFLDKSVGPWLQRRAKERFANEGDDVVGKWQPLEDITNQMRVADGFPAEHPINRRTGELEAYITGSGWDVMSTPPLAQLTFPGGPEPVGVLGEKVSTAQKGASNPATVARPVVGLNEADLAFVLGAMATYISIAGRV